EISLHCVHLSSGIDTQDLLLQGLDLGLADVGVFVELAIEVVRVYDIAINQDEMLKAETGSRNRRRAAYAAAREHQCAFPHLGLNLGADVTVVSQYKSAVVKCLGHGRL